jgi:hypothetical protein
LLLLFKLSLKVAGFSRALVSIEHIFIGAAESPVPGFTSSCDIHISLRRAVFKDALHLLQCVAAIDFSIPQILL